MKVLFFASAREIVGASQIELEVNSNLDFDNLWETLIRLYPEISKLKSISRIARNCEYVGREAVFSNEDEVAIIPPVSGG